MKKIYLILCLTMSFGLFAQDVNIPDVNFKNALISEGVDKNNDGQIQVSEAEVVTKISVGRLNINDLTGIESFVNLVNLYCWDNQLTSLDVSKNTALTVLWCQSNKLTSLDVSKNTALTSLRCYSNQLTSLDVSKNTVLTELSCSGNQLTSLDVSNNTALTELNCYSNQLTNLDISNNTALTSLRCYSNQLTSLNVSIALTYLSCYNNKLTKLNLNRNKNLTTLYCYSNQLTDLDLSNNIVLIWLDCSDNQLTNLDISNNNALISFNCSDNNLKTICISSISKVNEKFQKDTTAEWSEACSTTDIYSKISGNSSTITKKGYSFLWNIIKKGKVTPNDYNCLTTKGTYNTFNRVGYSISLDTINTNGYLIFEALGTQGSGTAVVKFQEGYCQTAEYDISANTTKTISFKVRANSDITEFSIGATFTDAEAGVLLTDSDLPKIALLKDTWVKKTITIPTKGWSWTQSANIDVDFSRLSGIYFQVKDGESAKIEVDYVVLGDAEIPTDDPIVNIPDVNFKTYLVQNFDKNNDGEIQVSEAESVTKLEVFSSNIKNLTGIEFFVNLTYLGCSSNQLTSLDVSKNIALTDLYCNNNQLINLDISKNVNLTSLGCSSNQLASLDVSKNVNLTSLGCYSNQFVSLYLLENTALVVLDCYDNQLTSLDVSKNIALIQLDCNNNQLTNLDVSKNTDLTYFKCNNNQLTSLDLFKNVVLTSLLCNNNPNLKIICVNSNQNTINWSKDATAEWSTICSPINTLSSQIEQNSIILKAYNLQGIEVPTDTKGEMIILLYDNGKTEKVIQY